MKKILVEYCNMIAYAITGLVFGFAFFLLFLNFYHYEEVNETYNKQESDYQVNKELMQQIDNIKENINSKSLDNRTPNYTSLYNIQSRLNTCISKIDTDHFEQLLSKSTISISDVYEMQQFYKIDISNECLVKQLYGLIIVENDIAISPNYLSTIPFIEDNIERLKNSSDYVEKIIKNNSSYSFVSNSTKDNIYNQVKDSYYEIINDYDNAIDFIYDISVWYKNMAGGNV